MSLALSTLLFEWRRYLAAVIALALAGVLMLALSAMFIGIMQSFTATIDKSRAQLIILPFKARLHGWRSGRRRWRAHCPSASCRSSIATPTWSRFRILPGDFGRFFGPGKTAPSRWSTSWSSTRSPNGITLPDDFTDDMRRAIEPPYNIGIDASAVKQLGVKLGDQATVNGKTVRVALILEGYANSQFPNVSCPARRSG
jgi:putative ABC transport system permease protein